MIPSTTHDHGRGKTGIAQLLHNLLRNCCKQHYLFLFVRGSHA